MKANSYKGTDSEVTLKFVKDIKDNYCYHSIEEQEENSKRRIPQDKINKLVRQAIEQVLKEKLL